MVTYQLFGLRVAFDRPLDRWPLVTTTEPPDVAVTFGDVAPPSGEVAFVHSIGGGTQLEVWRDDDGWCWCYPDGVRIRVDAAASNMRATIPDYYDVTDTATYLIGPLIGFLLRRRNITCLHASTVRVGETTWAFCGQTGAGKSSITAALVARGATLVAEDISPLHLRDGVIAIPAGVPLIKLWPDSTARHGELPTLTPNWPKQFLPTPAIASTLDAVVLLDGEPSPEGADLVPLSARDLAVAMLDNVYGGYSLDAQHRADDLALFAEVATVCKGWCLGRTSLDAMCEAVEHASG